MVIAFNTCSSVAYLASTFKIASCQSFVRLGTRFHSSAVTFKEKPAALLGHLDLPEDNSRQGSTKGQLLEDTLLNPSIENSRSMASVLLTAT